jgi:hypothetical protein
MTDWQIYFNRDREREVKATETIFKERLAALKRCPIGEPIIRIPIEEVKMDDRGNCYVTMIAIAIAFAPQ